MIEKPKDSPLSDREWRQAISSGFLDDKPVKLRFDGGWHAIVYKRNRKWGDYWIVHKYEAGKMCAQGGRHYVVEVHCDPPVGGRFGYAATHSIGTGGLPANLPAEERAKIFAELEQKLRNRYGDHVITYPEVGSA